LNEYGYGIAIDSKGDVIISGSFEAGALNLGNGNVYESYVFIARSGFIAKLSGSNGATRHGQHFLGGRGGAVGALAEQRDTCRQRVDRWQR
jgi:hypothetical protein